MDLVIYLDKIVYINLSSGFYYEGKVISVDEKSLTLIDKTGKNVSISKKAIMTIREVTR